MNKRKRYLALLLSLVIGISNILIVYADNGGTSTGTGAALTGAGSGGAVVLGLVELENYAKQNYETLISQPTDEFKQIAYKAGVLSDGTATDPAYVGDYYMTLSSIGKEGWPKDIFTKEFVETSAFIPRVGYAVVDKSKVNIFTAQGDGYTDITKTAGPGMTLDLYMGTYNKVETGYFNGIEFAASDAFWGNAGDLANKTSEGMTFGGKKLVYADTSPEMAETFCDIILDGATTAQGRNIDWGHKLVDESETGGINILAAECQLLSYAIVAKFSQNPGTAWQEFNAYYICTPAVSPEGVTSEYRMGMYNLMMLAAVGRAQIACSGESAVEPVRELLKKAWVSRNANGEGSIICAAGFMVAGQRESKNQPANMYAYPAAMMTNVNGYTLDLYNQMMHTYIWDGQPMNLLRKTLDGQPMAGQTNDRGGSLDLPNEEAWYTEGLVNAHTRSTLGIGAYANALICWMYNYWSRYGKTNGGLLKYTGASQNFWGTDYGWESAFYWNDVAAHRISPLGTFVFTGPPGTMTSSGCYDHGHKNNIDCDDDSSGCPPSDPSCTPTDCPPGTPGCPNPAPQDSPKISLTSTPENKKVDECSDTNVITIDLKMSATSNEIQQMWNKFAEIKAKDSSAKMQIRIEVVAETEEGDPVDPSYYNQLTTGISDFTFTPGKTAVLTSTPFDDKATLTQYLSGAKSRLQLLDTNIVVCDKVINIYKAKMHLCYMGKSQDAEAIPQGEETDGKWAWDRSILYVTEDPHYYSEMRHVPVSEIKADRPYAERYEAMAGIPTTEDIYYGAGATEFMVNVDLKWRTEGAKRTYTITATHTNCIGNNTACTDEACPGHPQENGPPTYCGQSHSCKYCTNTKQESYESYRNDEHKGTCTYTVTINQNIENYAYMDIIAEELWKLSCIELDGKSNLQNPSKIKLDPELGYFSYHDQEGYSSGNGRLHFNIEIDRFSTENAGKNPEDMPAQLWGDTTCQLKKDMAGATHSTCASDAVTAINNVIDKLSNVYVTVVSDYCILETSEGYQHIAGYKYDSNKVSLADCKVSAGDFNDSLVWNDSWGEASSMSWSAEKEAQPLTFNEVPEQEKMWDNNSYCAAKWKETDVTTTGYTGEYESPYDKYENSNKTRSSNYMQVMIDHEQPNLQKVDGNTDFHDGNGPNPRYLYTGINILDSTTVKSASGQTLHGTMIPLNGWQDRQNNYVDKRIWSATDSIKPVTNGQKDTGHSYVQYTSEVKFKHTMFGKDFTRWTKRRIAPYSPEHNDVNDIVIHNPISNRDAVLISNDQKYDDRYWGDMEQMPQIEPSAKCPMNSGCQFSYRVCNQQAVHSGSCYVQIHDGYNCGFVKNTHKHTEGCYVIEYEWECNYVNCCHGSGSKAWSKSNTVDPVPCGGYHHQGSHLTGNTRKTMTPASSQWRYHRSGCSYDGDILVLNHAGPPTAQDMINKHGSGHAGCFNSATFTMISQTEASCKNELNAHNHTSSCQKTYRNVLKCTDPHHHAAGEPHDITDPKNHYPFADSRCYKACMDDSKHNPPSEVKLPDNSAQKPTGNAFINIDRDFQIYYPDFGDFEQLPSMLGISECTEQKGKGFVNNTDTAVWVRNKFMIIPVNVIDSSGNYWYNNELIDLNKLPIVYKDSDVKEWNDSSSTQRGLGIYTFTCVSMNSELRSGIVYFRSVATNAPEIYTYSLGTSYINFNRKSGLAADMAVIKSQIFDVIGSIGSLTIHDTGDPRFAELFKKPLNNGKWLIPNVVREVDYNQSNMIVADDKDVRLEITYTAKDSQGKAVSSNTDYHGTYGVTDSDTGGKNHEYMSLPLTSAKNTIVALRKEQMRPGYNLYMSIETLGNYYGENYDVLESGKVIHKNRDETGIGSFENFMQITPTYYELNLDTGKYKPVDIYMKEGTSYVPVYLTNLELDTVEYYNYLRWLEESARRDFTAAESKAGVAVQNKNRIDDRYVLRLPTSDPDILGTPRRQWLIDLDRTFIGSRYRYNVDYEHMNTEGGNKKDKWEDGVWEQQSQRWHFTLGLPSSSVFVYDGTKPDNLTKFQQEMKEIQDHRAVIVCTLNIKVRGEVWTLEYDGTPVNNNGLDVPYGDTIKHYPPPMEPDDPRRKPGDPGDPNKPVKDPIIVIYDNKRTSADDMQTQGTH